MVTYRKELERKGWHRPFLLRIGLIGLGLFIGLLGLFAWSLEQEKGGWEGTDLGHFVVEEGVQDVDEGIYRALVRGESGEILFEGASIEEVDEWIEGQRNRDFTVPILLLVGSVALVLVGVTPSPRKPDANRAVPRMEALT